MKTYETLKLSVPDILTDIGDPIESVYICTSGNIIRSTRTGMSFLSKGTFIGAENLFFGRHTASYSFEMPVELIKINASDYSGFIKILLSENELYEAARIPLNSLIFQIGTRYKVLYSVARSFIYSFSNIFRQYTELCEKNDIKINKNFERDGHNIINFEKEDYYKAYNQFVIFYEHPEIFEKSFSESKDNIKALQISLLNNIFSISANLYKLIYETLDDYINSKEDSLIYYLLKLCNTLYQKGIDTLEADSLYNSTIELIKNAIINISSEGNLPLKVDFDWIDKVKFKAISVSAPKEDPAEFKDINAGSLLLRLTKYAGWKKEHVSLFAGKINEYMALSDKYSRDDASKKLYNEITKIYYTLYKNIFFKYVTDEDPALYIEIFLDYGLLDERLLSIEQLNVLGLIEPLKEDDELKVFKMKDWLKAIYEGKEVPSKNEFDLDYHDTIRQEKIANKLNNAQVQTLLDDAEAKVNFEIDNLFKVNNRLANGNIYTFVPMLHEDLFEHDYAEKILSIKMIKDTLNKIKDIDYSLFYREIFFEDTSRGISKEIIQKEVLPVIILLPTTGVNGIMWQETTRKKTDSEARILLPSIPKGDFELMLLKVLARFRWELCKKIQGVGWSDIGNPSLTSEYADYIQFYRKNNHLTPDKKSQLKTVISRCKNNIKEVFVSEYITWIKYESTGSLRLNVVSRRILATYCPFPKEIRTKLSGQGLFEKAMQKFNVSNAKKLKTASNRVIKFQNQHGFVPDELNNTLEFYNK